MATFLELCQKVARESGTVEVDGPQTTVSQRGRLALIVDWVRQSWVDLQNMANWRFLYKEFPPSARLTPGSFCFDPSQFNITDHRSWIVGDPQTGTAVTVTPIPTETREDGSVVELAEDRGLESDLVPLDYEILKRIYDFGAQADENGQPLNAAINDQNQLCIGPRPDGIYKVRGKYVRLPQVFDGDDDQPEGLPAAYHEAIKWKAMLLLAEFDEANSQVILTTERNFKSYYGAMRRDLLRRGGPYLELAPIGGAGGAGGTINVNIDVTAAAAAAAFGSGG